MSAAPMPGGDDAAMPLLQLAYFSPLPPAHSGIADYSAEILPHLAQMADLTLFCEEPTTVHKSLHDQFDIHAYSDYAKMRFQFDLPIYQLGNNTTYHEQIYAVMRRYPGVAVLHDVILHHFIAQRTVGHGNFPGYTREMGYVLGAAGVNYSWAIRQGQRRHPLTELSLNQRILDLNLGVLVHSHYALELVRATRPQQPTWVVPAPIAAGQPANGGEAVDLPWREDAIIFATIGQVTAVKRVDHALAAFARLRKEMPRARYLLIGELFPDEVDLAALLDEHNLAEDVHVTGFLPDLPAFMSWLSRVHVVVNLRHPTLGETSAAALRALSAGKPLIVSDHGWYAGLPDDVALKVPPQSGDALLAAMRRLGADEQLRREMGAHAQRYASSQHNPAQTARAYMQAISQLLSAYA